MKPSSSSTIKFLCSYGGKILPRYQDGKLRYQGGETRVLAVERSISFHELLVKLAEICGESVSLLRCQLPTEDLDSLVSITSDEDLENIIEEYDRVAPSSSLKIRAFISMPKRLSPHSPTSSFSTTNAAATSSSSSSSSRSSAPTSPPISVHPASSTNNLISTPGMSYSIDQSGKHYGRSCSTDQFVKYSGRSNSIDVRLDSSVLAPRKSISMNNQRLSRCHMSATRPGMLHYHYDKAAEKLPHQCSYGNIRREMYLVHNGNYWQ